MTSNFKIIILTFLLSFLIGYALIFVASAYENFELQEGAYFHTNYMVWDMVGVVSCVLWVVFFGGEWIKSQTKSIIKVFSILLTLVVIYISIMFMDLPYQVYSCIQSLGSCTINLSVGKDCMPTFSSGDENQPQSLLKLLDPISVRERIFRTKCVSF